MFDGEHHFEVTDAGEGKTLFRHWEKFDGLLVPLIWALIGDKTSEGFEQMNAALKARVENAQ